MEAQHSVTVYPTPSFNMAPSLSDLRSLVGLKTIQKPYQLRSELGVVHTEDGQSSFVPRNAEDIDAWYTQNFPEATDRQITPTEGQVFVCCPHDEDARYFYPILVTAINETPYSATKASSLVVRQDTEQERLDGLCQIARLDGSLHRIPSKKWSHETHYLDQRYDLKYQGPFRSRPSGNTKKSLTAAHRLTDKDTVAYNIPGTVAAWTEGGRLHWVPKEPVCATMIYQLSDC